MNKNDIDRLGAYTLREILKILMELKSFPVVKVDPDKPITATTPHGSYKFHVVAIELKDGTAQLTLREIKE